MNEMQIKIACAVALFTRSGNAAGMMPGRLLSYGRHDAYGSSTNQIMYGGGLSRFELEDMVRRGLLIRYQHAGVEQDSLLLSEKAWTAVIEHTFKELGGGTRYAPKCDLLLVDLYHAQQAGVKGDDFKYDDGNGITQLERFGLIASPSDRQRQGNEFLRLSPAGNLLAPRLVAALIL